MQSDISPRSTAYWFNRSVSCSEALFTVLNRGAQIEMETEEQAAHALAGGVLSQGHACGMLWGSALASAVRARNKYHEPEMAGSTALFMAGRLADEFNALIGEIDCREIVEGPLNTMGGKLKYITSDKPRLCGNNAVKWAPQAHELIDVYLSEFDPNTLTQKPGNCAMETIKALGFEQRDTTLVAGFAGGLGLKGNVCGALAAGIFAIGLNFYGNRTKPRDSMIEALFQEVGLGAGPAKAASRLRRAFKDHFKSEVCAEIIGREFGSIDDHSEYLAGGGCRDLINAVSEWV